jgi:hypothetical protein
MTVPHGEFTQIKRTVKVRQAGPEAHEEMQVRLIDWRHLCEDIDRVRRPRVWLQRLASVALGISGATALAAVAESSKEAVSEKWRWLEPAYYSVTASALVLAAILFFVNWSLGRDHDSDIQVVKSRAADIESMFKASISQDPAAPLRITLGGWGKDTRWLDVAPLLNASIVDNVLETDATVGAMGDDPAPRVEKELVIEYELGGQWDRRIFKEHEHVRIP